MRRQVGTTSSRTASPRRHGLTLFELVLVMVLLCAVLAIAAPSLRGFRAGVRAQDAATQFVSLTRYARARAAAEARVYRLNVSADDGSYWLTAQEGSDFVAVGTDFGRVFSLPPNTSIEVERDAPPPPNAGGAGPVIDFYPDGRCDVAVVRMTDAGATGGTTVIACPSPAESFRVVTAEEAAGL